MAIHVIATDKPCVKGTGVLICSLRHSVAGIEWRDKFVTSDLAAKSIGTSQLRGCCFRAAMRAVSIDGGCWCDVLETVAATAAVSTPTWRQLLQLSLRHCWDFFRRTRTRTETIKLSKGHTKVHYNSFPVASPLTSWRGQKSVVSVVSCRFPNSTTRLVADLLRTCWPCR